MKRFSLANVLVFVLLLAIGCATNGQAPVTNQESKELVAKISGRRIGAELQKEYPEIAIEVYPLCQEIVGTTDPDVIDIAIRKTLKILGDEINDPLLAADIGDLMELLQIKLNIEISPDRLAIIASAAKGLVSGIELQKGEK